MKIYLAKDSHSGLGLSKIVKYLNSKCSFVEFEELPLLYNNTDPLIVHPRTHRKYLKNIHTKLGEDDLIILMTDRQYENNFFTKRKRS
jgi:hypothetical protein